MFISQIKTYACLVTVILLLTVVGMTKYELYSVEKEYKIYKDNINAQLNRAILEKTRIEAEQKAKYDKAKSDYDTDMARLTDALERMRSTRIVPREGSVPVAGSSQGNMPRSPENTGINAVKLATFQGTCDYNFYEAAMRQTLQCQALIDFVK